MTIEEFQKAKEKLTNLDPNHQYSLFNSVEFYLLTDAQLQRCYDVYWFEEDEVIRDAYIEFCQLHILYENKDGELTDYNPSCDPDNAEDAAKIEYIMLGGDNKWSTKEESQSQTKK